jgi:drug/metabolite transporter, DME family
VNLSTGELAALGCAFLWALNGLLLRTQSAKIPPATMNATRCAVAGGIFLLILPFDSSFSDLLQVPLKEWGLLFFSVTIGIAVGDTLYLVALKEIGISRAIALSGTFPLTTMLWEAVLLDHPPSSSLLTGSLLVAAGVVFLSRQASPGATAADVPVRLKLGVFLSLVASLFWGLSSVTLKPAIAHLTLIQANAVRMPMVAIFLFFTRILPSDKESLRAFDLRSFLIVASTGILGMGIGAYLFLYAINSSEVTKAVTLTSTAPLFGMIMGAIFLKEKLTLRLVLGMACCMAGVWVVV